MPVQGVVATFTNQLSRIQFTFTFPITDLSKVFCEFTKRNSRSLSIAAKQFLFNAHQFKLPARFLINAHCYFSGDANAVSDMSSPNVGESNGTTPLHSLLRKMGGKGTLLRTLIDDGADVNLADSAGNTPLHVALKRPRVDTKAILCCLVEAGVDVNATNELGVTPLMLATRCLCGITKHHDSN